MDLLEQIQQYSPVCEQEGSDKTQMLQWINSGADILTRNNGVAHLTASSWVVSPDRKQVLMIYHNLYNSWAWMGGHADGDGDLFAVAERETMEESGITNLKPLSKDIFSLEILTVEGHVKRGKYVSSHLHLNVTYLFEADPKQPLKIKPDENSGVCWIPVNEVSNRVSEPWMQKWVYDKLMKKVINTGY